jgi:Ion channel
MDETAPAGTQRNRLARLSNPGVWRFSTVKLLLALILLFAVTPFIENLPNGDMVESALFSLVMIASLRVAGRDSRMLLVAALLFVPAIAAKWLNHFFPTHVPIHYFLVFGIAFIGFVVALLLRFIVRTRRVDANMLSAGVVVYLMLGLLWSLAYMLLAQLLPGSFSFALADSHMDGFNAFYFSFGTLTTVGFGDITPISKVARTLAVMEAVMGTFYLAILISRLVGMYSPTVQTDFPQQSDKP